MPKKLSEEEKLRRERKKERENTLREAKRSLKNIDLIDQENIKSGTSFFKTISPEKVFNNVEELFKKEVIEEIIMETEGVKGLLKEETKRPVGRPRKDRGNRFKAGRIMEVLKDNHNERVIPMYDGFDPIEGEMTMLTPLEHRFAIIFTQTGNATKSAEMASIQTSNRETHSNKNWRKIGSDLMKRHHVKRAIGMMQKKICVAAALDAAEVISNIREIAALATVSEKYDAALKANLMLGEYLGIFGKTKEERLKNVGNSTLVEVFKTGEDLIDNKNDIEKLSSSLGMSVVLTNKEG